ncbi:hypothetical protein Sjap_025502 [Stephania japonica]|uniref:NB-ARC domain-containing protein n=1 Tax=Stephania japonica TaxID=461633 RepID=A0AAP0E1W7_9MAGN
MDPSGATAIGPCYDAAKWAASPISCRIKYFKELRHNVRVLEEKTNELVAMESDARKRLRMEEEKRRQPLELVNRWLNNVEKANTQVTNIIKSYKGLGNNFFSNLYSRLKLAKRVVDQIQEVDKLLGKRFLDGLALDTPITDKPTILFDEPSFPGQSTVEKKINEIMELVMNPEIAIIGVHGMGGIGKTYILKKVNDKVAGTKQFSQIIWVTVSKDVGGIKKLQNRIAQQLGEHFANELLKCEDEMIRASMLAEKLKQTEKFFLILDDLWEEISLKKVGIPEPSGGGNCMNCKIVLTTRFLSVCDFIRTHAIVEVKKLSEEEAWNLFKAMTGNQVLEHEEVEHVAREVVHQCGGLPLAIITVGPVMRRMRYTKEWRHTLKKLKSSKVEIKGPDGDVFQLLSFSYNNLKGDQVKKCFLYCAFYPEDHLIQPRELIEYWMAEGYLEEENREWGHQGGRGAEIDEGYRILQEIKDASLLETVQEGEVEYVRLHDLVRDLAVRIMREEFRYVTKAGMELTRLPELAWEKVRKISLMRNEIEVLPNFQLNCPNLSTFLLPRNPLSQTYPFRSWRRQYPPVHFPNSFFSQMPALRVLDMSHCNIEEVPSSISDLSRLRALYLQLSDLVKLPSLEKLQELQVLNLRYTAIQELHGLGALVNLRFLDLSYTSELRHIDQADSISNLTFLEDVRVHGCKFFTEDSPMNSTCIQQMRYLKRLEKVEMSFRSYESFIEAIMHIQWNTLKTFNIQLSPPSSHEVSFIPDSEGKVVCIYNLDICSYMSTFSLPANVEGLLFSGCTIPQLFQLPCIKKLRYLKKLRVEGSSVLGDCPMVGLDIEPYSLASLETLKLVCIQGLKGGLFSGISRNGCLMNLKFFFVDNCKCLKNLFSSNILQQLKNIEVIKATLCFDLEEILSSTDEDCQKDDCDTITTTEVVLPKLHTLYLWCLPSLQSISKKTWVCDSLQTVAIFECPGLRELPFGKLPSLENIYGDCDWWDALHWDNPKSKTLLQPSFAARNVFDHDVLGIGDFN